MVRFHLLGIPVGVHFTFLILVLFSPPTFQGLEVVMWVLAAFVAVLAHEMGHALVARRYGADVSITLLALGGFTAWSMAEPTLPRRRLVISAAGSAVGIVSGGITFLLYRNDLIPGMNNATWEAFVLSFWWASLVWGVLNWLPISRLDGGHMLASFLEIVWPRRARAAGRVISIVVGIAAIMVAVVYGAYIAAILVAFFVLSDLRSADGDPPKTEPATGATAAPTEPVRRPDFPI